MSGPALAAPTTERAATTAVAAAPTGGAAAMAEHCTRALNSYRGSYIAKVPAGPTAYDCVMGQGAQGAHVRALQSALTLCHLLSAGGIDGVYGPRTKASVKWRYYSGSNAMCAS
ncbi:peptidoglycan-binding protein [Streptomyces sp. NPDC057552]|uniref:peptidoglycan-binding domain-containing protein n=1 Tax=Streptomyces sp. NPDC057552 TaxID=3350537 RepID=UPI0036C20952